MSLSWQLIGSTGATEAEEVDVTAAHALQRQGAQLIDVREPDEFRAGHAAGARNIPLGELRRRLQELQAGTTVLLICESGSRSWSGQLQLQHLNAPDVRNVIGGTSAWRRARLPMQAG
jgi:rhodanese-related sulfurtransferase